MTQLGHNGGPKWIDYAFDIESLPNIFTAVIVHCESGMEWIFEVSDRRNDSLEFQRFLWLLSRYPNIRMVGYNNIGYDYPVIHHLLRSFPNGFMASDVYAKSKQIINTPWDDRFKNTVRPSEWLIKQVDLFKVHHFDNKARRTSLKQIEIALRMACVVEFELDFDNPLPLDQIPYLLGYNRHDVAATRMFWRESRKALAFRDTMSAQLGEDMTNQSDSNIGSKVFITELERVQPGICGRPGRWRQTPRNEIRFSECVFPYVQFQNPEFQEIHNRFMTTTVKQTKDAFKWEVETLGMVWKFGTGGIHAAKDGRSWIAGNARVIQARDVKSYYPNLSISNRVYPEHLSEVFCDVYKKLYDQRAATPKKDPANKALKLALNGTYGNSNSKFSPFYDPKFTMTITINGQLLLCMLSEWLDQVPTLDLIQANTDGVMYSVDAEYIPQCDAVCARWEQLTGLILEADDFNIFAQRDVNNYLARDTDGNLKSKGAFEYQHGLDAVGYEAPGDGENWHKNQSSKIIAIAAENYIVNGTPVAETVNQCDNPFYFMETVKVQRNDRVMLGGQLVEYDDHNSPPDAKGRPKKRNMHTGGTRQQRVGRYYIAHRGEQLYKIMPPQKKLPHHYRPQAIEKGWNSAMCNDLHYFDWNNLNRAYYIEKAQELVSDTGYDTAHLHQM